MDSSTKEPLVESYTQVWKTFSVLLFAVLVGTGILFSLLFTLFMFPIYALLVFKNKDKDRDSPIYPIILHFYRFSWFLLIYYILLIIITIYNIIECRSLELTCYIYVAFHVLIGYFLSFCVSPIFNLLLVILAIQRFFLYFSSKAEQILNFKTTYWTISVISMYAILLSVNVWYQMSQWKTMFSYNYVYGVQFDVFSILLDVYFVLEILATLSALVYIPMFYSVKKLSHLPSVAESQPEKYIKYQVMFISFGKLMTFLAAYFSRAYATRTHIPENDMSLRVMTTATFFMTPVIIQTTYLFCSKKNAMASWATITFRINVRHLWGRTTRERGSVYPSQELQ